MTGRKPIPAVVKLLQGNRGKRPIPDEPKMRPVNTSEPPEWLEGEAKAIWAAAVPDLIFFGFLTMANREVFAGACYWWGEFREKNRTAGQRKVAYDSAVKLFRDFGLTPAELARLGKVPKKETPGSKWGDAL